MNETRLNDTHADVTMRPATDDDIAGIIAVLGDAFREDDPFGEFIFPDPTVRARREPRMLSAMIKHRFLPQKCAVVALVNGQIVAVLLWNGTSSRQRLIHKIIGDLSLLAAMRTRVFAGMAMDKLFASVSPDVPHIMAVYFACSPGLQHRGIGYALMQYGIKHYRVGAQVYLTCKDGNVEYYRQAGFELVERPRIGRLGPIVNVMRLARVTTNHGAYVDG